MNKTKSEIKDERINGFYANEKLFIKWWKQHRHSGFRENREGKYEWTISPLVAWNTDCYRVEFNYEPREVKGDYYYSSRFTYPHDEVEKWFSKQKEYQKAVSEDEPVNVRRKFMKSPVVTQ